MTGLICIANIGINIIVPIVTFMTNTITTPKDISAINGIMPGVMTTNFT